MEELTAWLKFGITLISFIASALGIMKMFIAYLEKRDLTIAGAFRDTLKEALLQEGRHISHENNAKSLKTEITELKEEFAEYRKDHKELQKTIDEGFKHTHQRIDKLVDSKTPRQRTQS